MLNPSIDNEMMNAFNKLIPFLSILFDNEASFAITDREQYILNHCCPTLKLNAKPGDLIPKGGAAYEYSKRWHRKPNAT